MNCRGLREAIASDIILSSICLGDIPIDKFDIEACMIKGNKRYKSCLIVNTDESDMQGSHWLALYLELKSSSGEFFDSLGKTISSYDSCIKKFFD